jgi:hypothetical protein
LARTTTSYCYVLTTIHYLDSRALALHEKLQLDASTLLVLLILLLQLLLLLLLLR